jgi:hypothetical protein
VNTNAPVGTAFNITFTVFDSFRFHHPPQSASIIRTIIIAPSCPAGQFKCPDVLGNACSLVPCYLLEPVKQHEPVQPPDIYLDQYNLPTGSVQLLDSLPGSLEEIGGLVRPESIRVWGVCGWPLPINLVGVCGRGSVGSCAETTKLCALHVPRDDAAAVLVSHASDAGSLVTCTSKHLKPHRGTANESNKALDRQCQGCSAQMAMRGQCEPSRHRMTMHGVDVVTGEQGAAMKVELVLVPAVVDARMSAQIAITPASGSDLQVLLFCNVLERSGGSTTGLVGILADVKLCSF